MSEVDPKAKALENVFNLLGAGLFQGVQAADLANAQSFIQGLYREVVGDQRPVTELPASEPAASESANG